MAYRYDGSSPAAPYRLDANQSCNRRSPARPAQYLTRNKIEHSVHYSLRHTYAMCQPSHGIVEWMRMSLPHVLRSRLYVTPILATKNAVSQRLDPMRLLWRKLEESDVGLVVAISDCQRGAPIRGCPSVGRDSD